MYTPTQYIFHKDSFLSYKMSINCAAIANENVSVNKNCTL